MVAILLAVYNGEKYLKEQIESILSQTFTDFKIIIRDDGSKDNSPQIIEKYCEKYPQKIFALTGNATGSAAKNFAALLQECDEDYIMFCDQDDVWLPEKIEKTLAAMKNAEENPEIPVLVHTDLQVVDGDLNVISPSFFNFQQLKQNKVTLPRLLVQNYVTGCTIMINRALKQKCGKIPDECIMHDWWLALTAVLFGKLVCVQEPTMLYRQHANNQVGAKAAYGLSFIKRKLATLDRVRANYNATYTQADALFKQYENDVDDLSREIIKRYCLMQNMRKCKKIRTMRKYDFKKCTRLRVIGQYIIM